MSSPLHSAGLADAEALTTSTGTDHDEEHGEGEEVHVHLPNPSLWPAILSFFLLICIGGMTVINSAPWITIISVPFVLVGILGWALEDPFAQRKSNKALTAQQVFVPATILDDAEGVVDRTITISSTAYSTHPVKVEIEREGVILALYGKVELEEQREHIEAELLKLPGVIGVNNYMVAEDAILNAINRRIEDLRAAGKLDGAKDISVLVENYIANLYGEVPDDKMKYLLEREIIGIPGVRVVVNRINLADIPGNLGKTRNKI